MDRSDEGVLEEVRRVAALVRTPTLTRKQFSELARVSAKAVARRFGSWKHALALAGMADRYSGIEVSERMKDRCGQRWSRHTVIAEMRRVSEIASDDVLTKDFFDQHASCQSGVPRRLFGSWRGALEAAGLNKSRHAVRYSDEECFENLLRVWTHYGRPPKYIEMNRPPSIVGAKAYMRWRSWNRALAAFVDYANNEEPEARDREPIPMPSENLAPARAVPPAEPRQPSLGLRYKVLRRDSFRCVKCGDSPAVTLSCRLHIDHIVPFSLGGLTVYDNLRTLCASCNLGRGVAL